MTIHPPKTGAATATIPPNTHLNRDLIGPGGYGSAAAVATAINGVTWFSNAIHHSRLGIERAHERGAYRMLPRGGAVARGHRLRDAASCTTENEEGARPSASVHGS